MNLPRILSRPLGLLVSWGLAAQLTGAATVTPDHQTYLPGEDLAFAFAGGPGNATDWIGVYPEDVAPGTAGSTRWNYVNNTRQPKPGITSGSVSFPGGVQLAGTWTVYYLLNDGYSSIATNQFTVLEPTSPLVRVGATAYSPGQAISVRFTNGPANPKDWIAIFREGQTPGAPGVSSTLWFYVDGTKTGATGQPDGTINFTTGLTALGDYVAYYLENDGYTVLARDRFKVAVLQLATPQLISLAPADLSSNAAPAAVFSAVIQNGLATLVPASVRLKLDDVLVTPQLTTTSNRITIEFAPTNVFAPHSSHVYRLEYADSSAGRQTNQSRFSVMSYSDIQLGTPLFLETFDSVTEGGLPAGWTELNYTEVLDDTVDFGSLNSAAYKTWTVVNSARFEGRLVTYSNPDGPVSEQEDMQRVLTPPVAAVVNGQQIRRLATGRMLFADSGYRRGSGQVMFVTTTDYSLVGKTNVHLSFHALMEQNQDSIGTVEYSVNGGASWLPIAYYLATTDLRQIDGAIDVEGTLTAEQADTARFADDQGIERGTTYGSYLSAPLTSVRPEHFQPRIDDNPADGKRVELFRLPAADNQSRVRFRLGYAGTDSWYFGVDNFGLYSISATPGPGGPLSFSREGEQLRLSWGAGQLQTTTSLAAPQWQPVSGPSPLTIPVSSAGGFYRLVP